MPTQHELSAGLVASILAVGGGATPRTAGAEPTARVTPIDAELGLADVLVRFDHPTEAAWLEVPATDSMPNDLRFRMRRLGPASFAARVQLERRGDPLPAQPHPASVLWADDGGDARHRLDLTLRVEPQPGDSTPSWTKGRVWYQIMTERFADRHPGNDPTGLDVTPRAWDAPWETTDLAEIERAWARMPLGELIDPDAPGGVRDQVIWHRRYGGDLLGVTDHLRELEELGITGIYFTPIFHAESLHKYEATDHRHVDPTFGPLEPGATTLNGVPSVENARHAPLSEADRYFLDTLMPGARDRGMRIIIDGVWNHVGTEHWAFQDVLRRGVHSRFASWFDVRFDHAGRVLGWEAWDRPNGNLPEFRQNDAGVPAPPALEHIMDMTRRWMDPNADGDPTDGIDGWRLDVVPDMGVAFWRQWHRVVRDANPRALTVSEIWTPASDMLGGDLFDAQMNYPFAIAVTAWLGRLPEYSSADLAADLRAIRLDSPAHELTQMNLLVSHDTERLVSMLMNPGRGYDQGGSVLGDSDYDLSPPTDRVLDLAELGFAMLATWPGSPMIYAGEEWAMVGGDDPDNRRPVVHPDIRDAARGGSATHAEFRARAAAWLRLRQRPILGPILRYGDVRIIASDHPDVFAFARRLNGVELLVVLNRGDEPASQRLDTETDIRVPARAAVWKVRE